MDIAAQFRAAAADLLRSRLPYCYSVLTQALIPSRYRGTFDSIFLSAGFPYPNLKRRVLALCLAADMIETGDFE